MEFMVRLFWLIFNLFSQFPIQAVRTEHVVRLFIETEEGQVDQKLQKTPAQS